MPNSNETDLASAPVGRLFLRLAVPSVTAQIINVTYNIADRIYIGHIPKTGALSLTGIGITMPVILAVSSFSLLVSMGGAPRASIALGQKEHETAEKILGTCAFSLAVISVIITAILLLFSEKILSAFGASPNTLPYATEYVSVYCLGTIFVQLSLGLNSFITSQGFALTSMFTVVIGAVINIVLDPIFIYVFNMGVNGAALATIISQAVSSIWVIKFLISDKSIIKIRRKYLKLNLKLLLPCVALGTSPFLMQLTENLVAVSFNTALLKYGNDTAVGAVTILSSIMNFTMLLLVGLTQGAQPILSYNLGAGNFIRVKSAFRHLLFACLSGSAIIWFFCMFTPSGIAAMFTNDTELSAYTAYALRIYMSMSLIFGIQVACQYSFVALNNAKSAIFLSIYRKILILIPLIFILPHFFENKAAAVFVAEPAADTIAVCTTLFMFIRFFKTTLKSDQQTKEEI